MAWKHQRTHKSVSVDADIDLDQFSEEELLQGLIDSKWISESEAEAITKRHATARSSLDNIVAGPIDDELEEASAQLRRGNKAEAIIHLERFLGRDWIGALQ